jgi:hypothetical protein
LIRNKDSCPEQAAVQPQPLSEILPTESAQHFFVGVDNIFNFNVDEKRSPLA